MHFIFDWVVDIVLQLQKGLEELSAEKKCFLQLNEQFAETLAFISEHCDLHFYL